MAIVVVDRGAVVGGRSGEDAKVGRVARSHGGHGDFPLVDMEFLCTSYVISYIIRENEGVTTFLASEK